MNRIYRIVFNRSLGLRQVVSELARSRGKGGTRIRRMALSISAAIETFNQPLSMTVPSPAPHRPESSRRRYAQAVGLALPVAMSLGVMFPVAAHADTHLGSSTIGVNLSNYQMGNPFFVDLGITIVSTSTDGISGGPAAYTLTNNGTIASGVNSAGVLFAGGGSLTNNGSILGGTFGVYLGGTSTSAVTNSGSISGIGSVAEGIQLRGGGVVSNASTGVISGTSYGVRVFGVSTVTNAGQITGIAAGGVYMEVGGTLVNQSSIMGGSAGVITNSGALDVTNSGNIVATSAGGIGVYLHGGGSVTNTGTSTISGALNGIRGFGATVDVNNTNGGSISATDISTGIGVYLKAGGSVTNEVFSEINGGLTGIRIDGGAGTVTNNGYIVGGTNGVLMEGGGLVHNSGTITGTGDTSVLFGAANALATVTNDAGGLITGSKYGVHSLTTNSTITNSGMIQSTGAGVRFDGAGTITNSGTIFGTVAAKGVEFISSGVLTNQAGGYIKTGSISVLAQNAAVNINNYGRIVTTGTITDTLRLLQGGTVTNAANATISGGVVGIYMAGGGSVTNGSSATIYGIFTGIQIGGSATVTNAGTISSFSNSYNSVLFTDNNNLLILQTGSSLIGAASATGTGSELQLDGSGSSGNSFSGFGTVSATAGTQWALSNDFSVAGGLSVSTDTGSQITMSGNVDSQGLTKQGDGTLVIDGTATNSGSVEVMAGRLIVGSDIAHASAVLQGDVQVDSGAIIGGHGELSGNLNVLGGGHLAPGNSIGTLTVGGDLTLAQGSLLDFEFGAPGTISSLGASDSVAVHGSLSLNGTVLNISNTGSMGPGLYNLFTYDGSLTESNGGILFGSPPGSVYSIQNLTASKQINLIDAAGVTLNFWNANGQARPNQMGGGSGTWSATAPRWTDSVGSTTGAMTPQPGFAIFGGAAGLVTVDSTAGAVSATGLQFASDGYALTGDTLTLVGSNGAAPVIHVGNGSAASVGWTATIGNVIAGSDGIDKTDLGTLVLTGSNTYTGITTIDAGTLALQGAGSIAGTSGVIANGTFDISGTNAYVSIATLSGAGQVALGSHTLTLTQAADTFAGAISGSGGLVIAGNESLTGSSSYSGGTQLMSGNLTLGSATSIGSGTLAMANGTSIAFGGSFTLANAITLSGDPAANVATGITTELSGAIADGTSAGDLVKTGGGTLLLSGTNTYTGATEVAAGTLDLQGSVTSAITVDAGAILTGIGVMGSLHATAGATVAPGGDAIGTLTVRGNAAFESGSNYQVNVTDTGSSDLIHATGAATLRGGTVVGLAAGTNWDAGEKYTILTADGGVTGTFGSVTSNFAFLTPTLVYDADNAYLSLARNDLGFATIGLTRNERATAAAIEALGAEATLYQRIVTLDAAQAVASFDNLAGASLASNRTAIIDDSRYVRDAIGNHLQGIDDQAQSDDTGNVWTSTWGHWGSNDGNANTGSQNSNGSGLLVGADRDLGNTRLGAVIGHSQLSSNSEGDNAHGTADHIGLYAATEMGAWQLQGGAAHSWYQTSSQRSIVVPGLAGHANADYNGGVTQAYVDGGYQFGFAQGSLTPFVNLAHVWLHEGAIHERGSLADLNVQANSSGVSYGTAGLRGSYTPTKGIELHASLGYQHAWGDLASTDTQRFAGGVDSFTVDGVPVAKNAAIADAGLRFDLRKNISVDATYHGQFGGQAKDQSARLALNVSF